MSEEKQEKAASEEKREEATQEEKSPTEQSEAAEAVVKKKPEEKTVIEEVTEEAEKSITKKTKAGLTELSPEEIKPGMIVRVHQKIVDTNSKGEEKERIQVFQGMVLAHKHGDEAGATITVRKVSGNVGVEKIFPLAMPTLEKIELVRTYRVRQSRPYFLRTHKKRLSEVKE